MRGGGGGIVCRSVMDRDELMRCVLPSFRPCQHVVPSFPDDYANCLVIADLSGHCKACWRHCALPFDRALPANTTCSNNDVLMSGRRRRRWANIKTSLFQSVAVSPSKHETLTQCWIKAGTASQTVGQHWSKIESTSRVCWAAYRRRRDLLTRWSE